MARNLLLRLALRVYFYFQRKASGLAGVLLLVSTKRKKILRKGKLESGQKIKIHQEKSANEMCLVVSIACVIKEITKAIQNLLNSVEHLAKKLGSIARNQICYLVSKLSRICMLFALTTLSCPFEVYTKHGPSCSNPTGVNISTKVKHG